MSASRATPTERAAAASVADAVAAEPTAPNTLVARHPWLGYVGPFAVFMLLLVLADRVPLAQPWARGSLLSSISCPVTPRCY